MVKLDGKWSGLYAICGDFASEARGVQRVESVLRGGAQVLQLRVKDMTTRKLLQLATEISRLTCRYGALFIVNDRLDVALASGADGVHLGEDDLPVDLARRIGGGDLIIGASAGSPESARLAEAQGADYIGAGPVYPTASKKDTRDVIGPGGLSRVVRSVSLPVIGIGGIGPQEAQEVMETGAAGVAVISALFDSPDPEERAREFVRKLGRGFQCC